MRYFRYKHTGRVYNDAWKAEFAQMTKDEQKNVRRNKVLDKVGATVLLCVMFACFVGCGIAINQIPKPESSLLLVLYYFVKILLWIVSFGFSGFVGYMVASPILKKITNTPYEFRRKALYEACAPLRKFYGVQEFYILTKCFVCSDEKFNNHDVCIFVHGDELRITTDLFRGFAYGDRDLGCYAFKADEISLTKQERAGHLAVELKADKVAFLLGYRAKGFVEKYFLADRP